MLVILDLYLRYMFVCRRRPAPSWAPSPTSDLAQPGSVAAIGPVRGSGTNSTTWPRGGEVRKHLWVPIFVRSAPDDRYDCYE